MRAWVIVKCTKLKLVAILFYFCFFRQVSCLFCAVCELIFGDE